MRPNTRIIVAVFGVVLLVIGVLTATAAEQAESVSMLLEKGIFTEETVGDLDAAIQIYRQIVSESQVNRTYVAQAHYRLGICYLKKAKNEEAIAAFRQLIDQFPEQSELVAQARQRLAALGEGGPEPVFRQITDRFGVWDSGIVSPDGKYISDIDWDTGDLVVYELDTGERRRLTRNNYASGNFAWCSAISPDSKHVAYGWWNADAKSGFCDLRVIGMDDSEPRVLVSNEDKEMQNIYPVQWSPEGKRILAHYATEEGNVLIVWVSAADGSVKVLRNVGKRWPEWMCHSPDGRYIVYDLPQEKGADSYDIFVLDIQKNREIRLVEHPADDRLFGWSPDGRWILFGSDRAESWDAWVIPVSDGNRQGLEELVMRGMPRLNPRGFAQDGSFYVTTGYDTQEVYIATVDIGTGKLVDQPEPVPFKAGRKTGAAWSHDGQYLACGVFMPPGRFSAWKSTPFEWSVCVYSVRTGEVRRISHTKLRFHNARPPEWSADDKFIYVVGSEKKKDVRMVYKVNLETGIAAEWVKAATGFRTGWISCSPDGKSFFYDVYTKDRASDGNPKMQKIMVKDLRLGTEKKLYSDTNRQFFGLVVSPDSRLLAFGTHDGETRSTSLQIMPSDGGESRELLSLPESKGIHSIEWMPDGQDLLFWRKDDPGVSLWKISSEGSSAEKLWHLKELEMIQSRIYPDEGRIAFTSRKSAKGVWVMENFLPETASAE